MNTTERYIRISMKLAEMRKTGRECAWCGKDGKGNFCSFCGAAKPLELGTCFGVPIYDVEDVKAIMLENINIFTPS